MQYKYIVFDHFYAVCFSGAITHKEIACGNRTPTSAGFFTLEIKMGPHGEYVDVNAFGASESLGLNSCDHDRHNIALALGLPK